MGGVIKSGLDDIVSENSETISTNSTNKTAKAIARSDAPFEQNSTNKIEGIYVGKIFCPEIPITSE